MDNEKDPKDGPSHNWFSGLRRKFQKKFKRNRHKLESSASLDDILDCEPEIPIEANLDENEAASASSKPMSAQDCEEMKRELLKLSFYWPTLSRLDAQKLLSNEPNGSFLLRDSSQMDSFTLSFRTNSKTFHCRNQWSQILSSDSSSHSLIDIIEHTIKKSQSSIVGFVKCDSNDFPTSYALRLIFPICRHHTVPSLQSICLSKIKSKIENKNSINSLPLPPKIKEYVRESYNTL